MGGIFGVVSKQDCVEDLFYGTDYHSHLGTRRGGMTVLNAGGFERAIHNIENTPFRSKFENDVQEMSGRMGIGCISDTEPQPLIIRSHLGDYAMTTVGRINNTQQLVDEAFDKHVTHFLEMSGGVINDSALANFNSEIALMGGMARVGSQSARAIWTQPLVAHPGQDVEIWLDWRALKQTETSYKVFVHLIQNYQLAAPPADYYTPLGGAFPTALWIPVWVEGQAVSDPHRLTLPSTLAPGEYALEIGLYDLFSKRRATLFDHAGSLAGDRVILGPISVR